MTARVCADCGGTLDVSVKWVRREGEMVPLCEGCQPKRVRLHGVVVH